MSEKDNIMEQLSAAADRAADRAAEKPKSRRVVKGIVIALLVVIVGSLAVAAGYYGRLYLDRQKLETDDAAVFLWEGDYIDSVKFLTTMSVEPQVRKGFYNVTICMGDENDSDIIFWRFTAVYNKETNTLVYSDGVRKDMITTDGDDPEVVTEEIYTGGSGSLQIRPGGTIIWQDDEENFGKGIIFERS